MNDIKELVTYCHKVYEKGYVAATDGNLSVRTAPDRVLITKSAICKGDVLFSDVVETNLEGRNYIGREKISTESKLHFEIYKHRPEIKAVIHCHPIYSTAFASSPQSLDLAVNPEVVLTLGRIPLCEYGTPGTDEVHKSLLPHIEYANCFLLQNHGAVTVGRTLKEAYFRMEKLEHFAHIIYLTQALGGPVKLNRNQLEKLYAVADKNYGIKLKEDSKF